MDAKDGYRQNSTTRGRIQATDMKYLRAVTGVSIMQQNKVRNVDKRRLGSGEPVFKHTHTYIGEAVGTMRTRTTDQRGQVAGVENIESQNTEHPLRGLQKASTKIIWSGWPTTSSGIPEEAQVINISLEASTTSGMKLNQHINDITRTFPVYQSTLVRCY